MNTIKDDCPPAWPKKELTEEQRLIAGGGSLMSIPLYKSEIPMHKLDRPAVALTLDQFVTACDHLDLDFSKRYVLELQEQKGESK